MEKWRFNCKCETSTLQLVLSLSLIKDYNWFGCTSSVWNQVNIWGPAIYFIWLTYLFLILLIYTFNKCQEFYIIIE